MTIANGARRLLSAVAFASALASLVLCGCSSGDVGVQPTITSVDPLATSKLQFFVGVATAYVPSTNQTYYGLNTVETLRQPNGLSAVLTNTPYITGPPGFVGQNDPITGQATNIISGSGPGIPCTSTVFGCTGGAFGYGFAPDNPQPGLQNPVFQLFALPLMNGDRVPSLPVYYGGPPAFPQFNNGTYPAGFLGYSPGFVSFLTPPVLGQYKFDVVIPTGPNTSGTISATALLTTTTSLPILQPPQAFPDPNNPGGALIDIVVPPGVSETWVWVQDGGGCYPQSQGNSQNNQYYTIRTTQTGAQQLVLPPNLGPTNGSGVTPTICSAIQNQQATGNPNAQGDTYTVYAAGFDYPAYGAAYPFNLQQIPAVAGPNGQVDVTASQPAKFQYP